MSAALSFPRTVIVVVKSLLLLPALIMKVQLVLGPEEEFKALLHEKLNRSVECLNSFALIVLPGSAVSTTPSLS